MLNKNAKLKKMFSALAVILAIALVLSSCSSSVDVSGNISQPPNAPYNAEGWEEWENQQVVYEPSDEGEDWMEPDDWDDEWDDPVEATPPPETPGAEQPTPIPSVPEQPVVMSPPVIVDDDVYLMSPEDPPYIPGSSDDDGYIPGYEYPGSEQYLEIQQSGFVKTDKAPEATISMKVDTASYTNVRRFIDNGVMPPADAVRTEELINWFNYDELLKSQPGSPFGFYTEIGPSPFNEGNLLGMVRVATRQVAKEDLPPSNLVFLIDVSGSMDSYDKLPLLKKAFYRLTATLDEGDTVSIVTYASGTRVALAGANGTATDKINGTINRLSAGGSTAGAGGIQLAYELAEEFFIDGGNNRVILATDGDFNVGISSTAELSRFIEEKRESGIYLSVLGFGAGNIRDDIMETLAKDGNGNYNYIDSIRTAQKVLVEELGSNLFTVADDVKAQIVFNPDTIESYRLIGYENRMLSKEDFDDDLKDAGEIGAGSDVLVLFEFTPAKGVEVGHDTYLYDIRVRYKDPGNSESELIEFSVSGDQMPGENSSDFRFASVVAQFGDYLRAGGNGGWSGVSHMLEQAKESIGEDRGGYREEFIEMLYSLAGI